MAQCNTESYARKALQRDPVAQREEFARRRCMLLFPSRKQDQHIVPSLPTGIVGFPPYTSAHMSRLNQLKTRDCFVECCSNTCHNEHHFPCGPTASCSDNLLLSSEVLPLPVALYIAKCRIAIQILHQGRSVL